MYAFYLGIPFLNREKYAKPSMENRSTNTHGWQQNKPAPVATLMSYEGDKPLSTCFPASFSLEVPTILFTVTWAAKGRQKDNCTGLKP